MNMDLEEIIRYEHETTYVDFKREEYTKPKFHSFVKDVVSMANANVDGSRYIIVGVDLSNGGRDIVGVSDPLTDSAIYQNLLHQKVEPEIHLKYYPYEFDGVTLGIFEIYDCNDQPYMLKNEFQPLKAGDCFIRKGSTQLPLMRSDLNKIFFKKNDQQYFSDDVNVKFENHGSDILEIKVPREYQLRSEIEREKIEKAQQNNIKLKQTLRIDGRFSTFSEDEDYSTLSDWELKRRLEGLTVKFKKDDDFIRYEQNAYLLNFTVQATGTKYIEDCTVKFYFQPQDGLVIPEEIFIRPSFMTSLIEVQKNKIDYPTVETTQEAICVTNSLVAIKHGLPIPVFTAPLRLFAEKNLIGTQTTVKVEIYGKNVKSPITKELHISFV